MMQRLPILCVLLIIAVYVNAVSYSNEVDDDLLKDIDSPESFEDGFLEANIWNRWRERDYNNNRRERDQYNWKERDQSEEEESEEEESSKESQNKPSFLDDAVLPHEKFCKYFYVFDDEFEASVSKCSRGHRFDAEKLQCLKTREVNCGKRKKSVGSSEEKKARINFKCPKWSGLHQHEYYCNLYYSCQSKKGRLFMCPKGMLFDNYNKRCADRGNVDCNNRIDPNDDKPRPTVKPEAFVCPKSSGKYPHERDCSAFYKCDNRKYKIQYCSKGKLYNERKRTCESQNKVTCGSRIHPDQDPEEPEDKVIDPNPNFNCRENFGRYTHDQYCNWYYNCHDRRPSVRECRRGWRYHSHRRRCRQRHEVTCDGKPDREETTTEEITTTPTPTEPETTTLTPTEPETTSTPTEPETTPTPTEPETTTPTPTEPETTTPTPTEPETTPTPTKPETTTPTPTEPETTTPTPTEPETTTTPTEPETTTPTPTEPETTTPTPTEPETTTPTEPEPTTTTQEPTTTNTPKVTAPDTDCDEDDVDCIIEDLGITPDWFICPEDIGSYPHPSSRKLFIFCLNWKPSVKKCGQDLLYSEDLRTCVHP